MVSECCWVKCALRTAWTGMGRGESGEGDVMAAGVPWDFQSRVPVPCTYRRPVSTIAVVHPFWLCWYFLSHRDDESRSQGGHHDVPVDWVQAIKLPSCDLSHVIMVQFEQSREMGRGGGMTQLLKDVFSDLNEPEGRSICNRCNVSPTTHTRTCTCTRTHTSTHPHAYSCSFRGEVCKP